MNAIVLYLLFRYNHKGKAGRGIRMLRTARLDKHVCTPAYLFGRVKLCLQGRNALPCLTGIVAQPLTLRVDSRHLSLYMAAPQHVAPGPIAALQRSTNVSPLLLGAAAPGRIQEID